MLNELQKEVVESESEMQNLRVCQQADVYKLT